MMSSAANQSFCWRLVIRLNNCLLPTMCQACTENCPKIDEWNKSFVENSHWLFVLQLQSQVQLFEMDPMNYSMPGFPVLHYVLEFA